MRRRDARRPAALRDTGMVLPPGRNLTWLVTVPVRSNAAGADIETTVNARASPNAFAHETSASDRIALVIQRDGFEGAGAQGIDECVSCPPDAESLAIGAAFAQRFMLPAVGAGRFDTVLIERGRTVAVCASNAPTSVTACGCN